MESVSSQCGYQIIFAPGLWCLRKVLLTPSFLTVYDHLGGPESVVVNGRHAARVPPGEVGADVIEVQRAVLLVWVVRGKEVDVHVIHPLVGHLKSFMNMRAPPNACHECIDLRRERRHPLVDWRGVVPEVPLHLESVLEEKRGRVWAVRSAVGCDKHNSRYRFPPARRTGARLKRKKTARKYASNPLEITFLYRYTVCFNKWNCLSSVQLNRIFNHFLSCWIRTEFH